MRDLIGAEADDRNKALRDTLPKPARIRIAAFDGERFVGCSSGWFEVGGNFTSACRRSTRRIASKASTRAC